MGLKVTVTCKLLEGAKVIGKVGAVKRKLPSFDQISFTVAFIAPVLVTVKVLPPAVVPIG